jgi:predicted nucleic acid-binding Zn ribbon protein
MYNGHSYQCDICACSINAGEDICYSCQKEIEEKEKQEEENSSGPYVGSYYFPDEE